MKKEVKTIAVMILFLVLVSLLLVRTIAQTSGSSNGVNLTIWDDTDGGTKYTYCSEYCSYKGPPAKTINSWNVYFYANYTNETTGNPISSGNCTIRFNETGTWTTWTNMSYNTSLTSFEYNRSFNYDGDGKNFNFEINCTNASFLSSINITDNFLITNTPPAILKTTGGYIDGDIDTNADILNCTEDILCPYNFTANVSEDDYNDKNILEYSVVSSSNTTLTNYTFNETTSMLIINVTLNENTGPKSIELGVKDESNLQTAILNVNITSVNDAPVFVNLQNWSFNITQFFEEIINITDEENDIPFILNISFIECATAEWSSRNNTNCTLFNSSQYTFNGTTGILNISFIPVRDDVGSYIINFSVMDNSSLGNKTTEQLANFTVLNINSAPYFNYVCDNERNTTENYLFTCRINATDIDEINNLTFISNYSWFMFNNSDSSITVTVNGFTGYNASAIVNFTTSDTEVGNWSVNITVRDTGGGGAIRENSSIFWFFVNNTEDSVSLDIINNYTIYENKTIYVNATDNDLLVPDKNVKNEVLSFASNTSWVFISSYSNLSNQTTAKINIDFNTGLSWGEGNYTINVNVTDTANNYAEQEFVIEISSDNPAEWNASMAEVFVIYDNNETYFNFSENVSDPDNDAITFSFTVNNNFSSFSINPTTGIINFTPDDLDVGFHNVTINASDGMLDSLKSFNFTVYNVNEAPYIKRPIEADNAFVDSVSNINCSEDNVTTIWLWIQDDDFKIPLSQKNFYNENLVINLTIEGPNTTLFNFIIDSGFPAYEGDNRSKFDANFTPRKADIGEYNITINVTDNGNTTMGGMKSDFLSFNLTILGINHAPVLMNLTNQTSAISRSLYYRINATDTEDGNSTESGNVNFTFSYGFNSGENIFNSSIFNSTTGEINITFNLTQGGSYHLNITVNDSNGAEDSADFWIYVYDYPNVTFPASDYEFHLAENITSNLTFRANHSAGDNLTYEFYIENANSTNVLKYNLSYYGDNTNLTWEFIPNFTDETYGVKRNLTLIVYPPNFSEFNTTISWNVTINHTNAPVVFSSYLGDMQSDYNTDITINLSNYFSDEDYRDTAYNQTVDFSVISNANSSAISSSVSNWILTLSASTTVTELLIINATDLNGSGYSLTSALSNQFEVRFTPPSQTPTPSSGGGGGGSATPVMLKILLPDPISAYKKDIVILPITLSNPGRTNLYKIDLTAVVAKDGRIRNDIKVSFDQTHISSLLTGNKKNVTLTVDIDTDEVGLYEITINATVKSPEYNDWGKIQLTVKEANKTEVLEKLLFTEEFIAENPECIEITEILKEGWDHYERGKYTEALMKAREAIDACRYAIAQPGLPRKKETFENQLYKYLTYATIVLVAALLLYYLYKRIKIKRG